MGVTVKDDYMAQKAHRLLHNVFHTRTRTLARLIDQEKYPELEKHIKKIAAGNYSDGIVTGVHTVVVLAAKSACVSVDASPGFILGQLFTTAETFLDGSNRYMLSWLRQAKRKLPAWLEKW